MNLENDFMGLNCRAVLWALLVWALAAGISACNSSPRAGALATRVPEGTRIITVEGDQVVGSCYRFWTVANQPKPHTLAEPGGIKAVLQAGPFTREINCVYLLGGRWERENKWFLGVNGDGSVRTDFGGMIRQLKAVVDAGFVPRLVLDDVPEDMSDPAQKNTYGNTAPPKDEKVWGRYVQAAVEAMVGAFGKENVGAWTFRVGTEPDLYPAHWTGTKEEYLAHYDYTVEAVRRVLPGARVGPGNIITPGWRPANPRAGVQRVKWGLDIIDHAAVGANACTGGTGTAMDYFGCSWYTRVGQPVSNFDRAIGAMRERLGKYERFKGMPIEIGEFSVLGDERGKHLYAGETTEWSASFFAALADRVYALDVKNLYQWDSATQGVMHPRGRVIEMLEKMAGGERLDVKVEGTSGAESGALACRQGEALYLLIYNHRPERGPPVEEKVHVVVHDRRMVEGAQWRMSEWTIDREHGVWAYAFEADCKAAGIEPLKEAGLYEGSPTRLYGAPGLEVFKKNAKKYAGMSTVPATKEDVGVKVGRGTLGLDFAMAGHSVRLIRLSKGD